MICNSLLFTQEQCFAAWLPHLQLIFSCIKLKGGRTNDKWTKLADVENCNSNKSIFQKCLIFLFWHSHVCPDCPDDCGVTSNSLQYDQLRICWKWNENPVMKIEAWCKWEANWEPTWKEKPTVKALHFIVWIFQVSLIHKSLLHWPASTTQWMCKFWYISKGTEGLLRRFHSYCKIWNSILKIIQWGMVSYLGVSGVCTTVSSALNVYFSNIQHRSTKTLTVLPVVFLK